MRKQYLCERPCFHNGTLYRIGQVAEFNGDHPKDKKGSLRHFVEIGGRGEGSRSRSGGRVKEMAAKPDGPGIDSGMEEKLAGLLAMLDEAQERAEERVEETESEKRLV